jgi:hypothetical protein
LFLDAIVKLYTLAIFILKLEEGSECLLGLNAVMSNILWQAQVGQKRVQAEFWPFWGRGRFVEMS